MPPYGHRRCVSAVHVRLDSRHFIVEYDADGVVLRIKERKAKPYAPPGLPADVCDVSWWVASSHPLGSGNTIPKRVIAAAKAQLDAFAS